MVQEVKVVEWLVVLLLPCGSSPPAFGGWRLRQLPDAAEPLEGVSAMEIIPMRRILHMQMKW